MPFDGPIIMFSHASRTRARDAARILLVRLLPVLLLASLGMSGAHAQTRLESVVVTGTREPQPLARSSADIVVIDADTIRRSDADSVEDLLRREAGLQLARNGGPGQTSGYFLRGASTSQTLVLIDGVRVGSATLGQFAFESLGLGQIERIEVLRGPASSLYGADAVGGVIRIFTRRGSGAFDATADAALGGYRSRRGDVAVSGSTSSFDYALDAGRESSRGVSAVRPHDQFGLYNPDDDGFARNSGHARAGWTFAPGHRIGVDLLQTHVDAQYDSAEYAPPDYAPDASPDFRTRETTRVVAADYRGTFSSAWTTTLQLAHDLDDVDSGGTTRSDLKTHRDQATWQNAIVPFADQQLVVALEYLRESADGDVFADTQKRRNRAATLGWSGSFGANHFEASVRRDDNSAYGGNTTGGIGASREIVAGLKLRARAGTTFRAPTFNDLGYPGYGVPTIEPERGRSVEAGIDWTTTAASLSATVYRNHVRDLIGYDPDPNGTDCPRGDFGCAANIARARLQGLTLDGSGRWRAWTLHAHAELLDARDDDTGVRLARRAAHQESLALDYAPGPWSAGASLVDVGSRPDGGVRLGGYAVVDVHATWRFQPEWQVEAKLLNALDHRVEPVRDYQGLGRQAWIGLRYAMRGL